MLASGSFDEHLIHTLTIRLQHIEKEEADLKKRLDKCINACWETLLLLRQQVLAHPFPDQAAEIHFFKKVKPVVLSRHIYYQLVHRLHLDLCEGSTQLITGKLQERLQEIDRFFEENKVYYQYYRNDDTHHDELYFVRGKYDWKRCPHACDIGDDFTTSFDVKLAELMAYELLARYVEGLLNPKQDMAQSVPSVVSRLQCTASTANIVELGYALHLTGFFNQGKTTVKEIMTFLSETLGVDLQQYYHSFLQIRERKANVTKYLDELKANLLRYIEKERE